ncbi:MAG: ATP-binding cassette domain-containing protein, partial [Ezakiella sp.]
LVNISTDISQAGVSFEKLDAFTDRKEQKSDFDYASDSLASARNLTFKYKNTDRNILSDLNFDIGLGKTTVLWGESGSGKSTILKIVGGMLETDEKLKIHDSLSSGDFIRSDNWAYFPQSPNTFDGKIGELFKMINPKISEERMWNLLEKVGLKNYFDSKDGLETYVKNSESTFSGGEHRRLCLALFLGYDAEVMLFDEPTASLDKKSADLIIDIIADLRKHNKTCLISTHDVDLKNIGDEVIDVTKR